MEPTVLQAGPEDAGTRLDSFLAAGIDALARSAAQRLIEGGQVTVNGRTARASYEVKVGDEIAIRFGERTLRVEVLAVLENAGKADAPAMYREIG